MPSAFTPNNDGKNDFFRPVNLSKTSHVIEFKVFNRGGNLVFDNPNNPSWDGTFNGVAQDLGVYFYMIKVVDSSGNLELKMGQVTLIR